MSWTRRRMATTKRTAARSRKPQIALLARRGGVDEHQHYPNEREPMLAMVGLPSIAEDRSGSFPTGLSHAIDNHTAHALRTDDASMARALRRSTDAIASEHLPACSSYASRLLSCPFERHAAGSRRAARCRRLDMASTTHSGRVHQRTVFGEQPPHLLTGKRTWKALKF